VIQFYFPKGNRWTYLGARRGKGVPAQDKNYSKRRGTARKVAEHFAKDRDALEESGAGPLTLAS
jgi:hypothetical protein